MSDGQRPVRRFDSGFDWEDVERLDYKPEGDHFADISRRVLFDGEAGLGCELRYFEIQAGGHSTLERHQHVHAVMILRGRGRCLVGERLYAVSTHDLVHVPPRTWHQFRADGGEPLGFLCMVDRERDRPQRPDAGELEALRRVPELADFIRA